MANSGGDILEVEGRRLVVCGVPVYPALFPAVIMEDVWSAAEEAAEHVLSCVHPTLDSEEKRRDVVDYVQQLIKRRVKCEVVSFGSVPLKTYLPDGDIDLTVLQGPIVDESLAHDVFAVFQSEEQNENAVYEVKETRFIDAEVKLVKCLVHNIVIDISFNQMGGLSTLCFLEQVDRHIGRNHLFKRSIILIKAWCYYESRIHGAHHGLLSTYALETLILYIFQLFHPTLDGPIMVLHRFLDYYGQFDWDKYAISFQGPVLKSSLPNIVVKMPERFWSKLLTDDFLENNMQMFSFHSMESEAQRSVFRIKNFNIVDPIRGYNNLGRSVHKSNFYRIKSALKYGARKLGEILSRPRDEVSDEIYNFFSNTISRNRDQYKYTIPNPDLRIYNSDYGTATFTYPDGLYFYDDLTGNLSFSGSSCFSLGDNLGRCLTAGVEFETEPEAYTLGASIASLRGHPSNFVSYTNASAPVFEHRYLTSYDFSSSGDHHLEADQVALAWELDPISGGESEPFNPLADLTGDYDCHIRSFLCGQFCKFSIFVAYYSPASPSGNLNKKKEDTVSEKTWDTSREYVPLKHSGPSQVSSVNPAAQGSVAYSQQVATHMENSSNGWYWSEVMDNYNWHCDYGHVSNFYPSYEESYAVETGYYDFHPASSSHHEPSAYGNKWCQTTQNYGQENQANENVNSCRIQFGSVENLKELISPGSPSVQKSGVATSQKRAAGQFPPLKNDDEFPPLCP